MNKISVDINAFSNVFDVKFLHSDNLEEIYNLCKENTFFYEHCTPFVTRESILSDLEALPPKKSKEDKYYVGFYDGNKLIAVMDFINAYPSDDFCFIGFFMLDKSMQGIGIGGSMIEDLCMYLSSAGYKGVKLAWVETNYRAEKFWTSHGFYKTGAKFSTAEYHAVVAERLF